MAIFKFNDFVFDSERYQLLQKGKLVEMRPKAMKLLCLLIENRERVVSKPEIFTLVWGEAYARDHLLFQLISELRKAPFEPEFVRTQPNEGYRWNVPTKILQNKGLPRLSQVAASLALLIICASVSSYVLKGNSTERGTTTLLPAHSALTRGVVAMEAGRNSRAIEWFEFALKENPDSIESSLLLAETLLHKNMLEESAEQLYALLSKPNLSSYNTMTANDILSRIHQRQGSLNTALKFALRSSKEEGIAQCTVDALDDRVNVLANQLGFSQSPNSTEQVNVDSDANKIDSHGAPASPRYTNQCKQLKDELGETSFCPPNSDELYAYLKRGAHFIS